MRFLMKLALDSVAPLNTASRYLPPSLPTDTVSTNDLRVNPLPRRILQSLWKKIIAINNFLVKNTPDRDLIPLIKATTKIENGIVSSDLAGKFVLCVGGRAKLYPVYRHLVETLGGKLMTFHGNSMENINQLYELLTYADMVICPVDCVNHEAFFTVKHYCQCSGKHCVLLDRSQVATFQKGIRTLATMTADKSEA